MCNCKTYTKSLRKVAMLYLCGLWTEEKYRIGGSAITETTKTK